MGLKRSLSFSSGEIDPVLHDRVTLERFNKGLATARNIMISKTGSIMSRFSRAHFATSKNADEPIVIYSPPNSEKLIEIGVLYTRIYDFDGTLDADIAGGYSATQLDLLHFVPTKDAVYIFLGGQYVNKLYYNAATPSYEATVNMFDIPLPPTVTATPITTTGPATGYVVDYLVTAVYNGEESKVVEIDGSAFAPTIKLPIVATHDNLITVELDNVITGLPSSQVGDLDNISEIRVYRRPNKGSAYGFIGNSTLLYDNAGTYQGDYVDFGGAADFTNQPPSKVSQLGLENLDTWDFKGNTGVIYQQRLLMTSDLDPEAIGASRPGYQNNFYRDYPYDADSALLFKSGSSGSANVLRMIDQDGLIVFTSIGVFTSTGTLSVDNIALEKKGNWIIKEEIPPLAVPGGVFFVEKDTNTIQQLIFSDETLSYQTIDHTIFSNHLFEEKTIVSWGYQEGVIPMIIVTFSDKSWATFTYHFEHKMRAWTRHDSAYFVEQVEGTGVADSTFFVVNKDGQRHIEVSLPRKIPADTFTANPEADKLALNTMMDAAETTSNLLNDSLGGSDVFLLALTTSSWEDPLTLTCGTSALFPSPGLGDVGTVFRHFSNIDKSTVDLEVTARASDNSVTVQPTAEFPSAQASGFRMYQTYNEITGLDHLEGESVSVIVDGWVIASPNNDIENYDVLTVASGVITLPDSMRGAIVVVGRPFVADIQTLNISTVEQQSTIVESLTVNKLYIRVHKTRGLYISNKFPEEAGGGTDGSSVDGMEDLDIFDDPNGFSIIGNRYKQPDSKRIEQSIPGSWDSQGKISIRQVDPVHFEILSIIPDVEVLKRSDR